MPTKLLGKIAAKKFVASVQIDPPTNQDTASFFETIEKMKTAGVDVVDVNSSRRISHDSIQLSVALSQLGLTTIPHLTTRDSSINGLANQILAAYSLGGISDFLVITGDPHEASKAIFPSKGVFQRDATGAIKSLKKHLSENPPYLPIAFGAAISSDTESDPPEKFKAKIAAGADFFMSQPIFTKEQALLLLNYYNRYAIQPLLVGIWPMTNFKTLDAIRTGKIVGVNIPEETYRAALSHAPNEEKLSEWGLKEALALVRFLRKETNTAGVYLVAPFRNPLLLIELIKKI